MADASDFHVSRPPQRQRSNNLQTLGSIFNCSTDGNEPLPFDLESLSPAEISISSPSSSSSIPHLSSSRDFPSLSNFDSDLESDYLGSGSDSDCLYGDDNLNFVSNLFASREEYVLDDEDDSAANPFLDGLSAAVNYSAFGGRYDDDDFHSDYFEEIGLGFGSVIEFNRVRFSPESVESSVSSGVHSCLNGLRVVRMESDSDTEEVDVHSEVPDEEGSESIDGLDIPHFWDCLGFDDERTIASGELEWEEVDDVRVDEREGLSSVINRIEELSISSETSFGEEEAGENGEEAARNLDWEILLAVNNWTRPSAFDPDVDDISYLAVHDDNDVYDAEYDTIFGQFAQNEGALKGSPPASKFFMENLPLAVLTKEELQEKNVACAVCKEEILVEEKVIKLPCCHYYHRDCIIPWLGIRNTCPVCRYELPTDDPDYEQRKAQRNGLDLPENLEVRYSFELFP